MTMSTLDVSKEAHSCACNYSMSTSMLSLFQITLTASNGHS